MAQFDLNDSSIDCIVGSGAGGGTLISFPALLAVGYPALTANVTSTVGIWPGYLGGVAGFRREVAQQGDQLRRLELRLGHELADDGRQDLGENGLEGPVVDGVLRELLAPELTRLPTAVEGVGEEHAPLEAGSDRSRQPGLRIGGIGGGVVGHGQPYLRVPRRAPLIGTAGQWATAC